MALDKFQPYLFVSAGEQSNKYLTPVISPDGIASFQAQRAQDLSGLTIRIEGVQEGSGDPSPTNVRAISGRTGMTVTRAGKNLLEPGRQSRTAYGITYTRNTDGSISISGTATNNVVYYFFDYDGTKPTTQFATQFPNGTYIVTGGVSNSVYISGFVGDSNQGTRFDDYGNGAEITVTNGSLFAVRIVVLNGATVDTTIYPMIRLASDTDDTYEPYTGTTTPVTWETEAGTVYGGTLDVVSGVLTVDWNYIASYNGETLPGEWISDRDVYAEGTTPTTGAEVAYKLAEPVTYQLDPEQIMTLPGFNQIYSDAGPVIDIKF